MENNNNNNNNKNVVGHGYSSLDYLFGPKDSSNSASSSSTTGLFGSIFPPPSTVHGRENKRHLGNQLGSSKYEKPENMYSQSRKGESSGVTSKDSIYQNETVAEPCYFSSSIYYGGQENYSPRTRTTESQHSFKKDGSEDDPNGNNSNSASRGNWWQGSLYY
ncbi:hypothetical protein L484_010379 [Morus notabilis]|uniref:Uncharacterized protein n=1 Tax=Morus notabilis TaxID=981085 RepID=W9S7I3_9ROSA|nr:store-operated calcium entry-associated regulatory factor [Morus notabilis]EXC19362.1 hypothetical protein L484_010379 [Morus notabilis]